MALFQASVLKDQLRLQDEQQIDKAYKSFTSFFHNPDIQENIRSSKEEQFQATFLNELFVRVLGFTMNPQPEYNLTTEFKNQKNARKADGAILKEGMAIGVIELKGTNTKHLEGIRQQAFDYKANQKGCVYVITSNFEKLRFYINDATEFLEFDLFELNREDFSLLWFCLSRENLLSGKPLKVKEASLVEEEVITKQFYKDYSVFKRELYRDLVRRNAKNLKSLRKNTAETEAYAEEDVDAQSEMARLEKNVKQNLFKKSQKLIDRFLFIFFAEDRALLPPNSIHKILEDWNKLKDLDAEMPLYDRFRLYFGYLDTGRKGTEKKAEIFAYNGGLFKPDPVLDMLEIDDELLYKHTSRLATYDFESQVDVNILGHIFENSLNEIESVNAEIEGADFDKQKSKRKKDGVFYTPKYITKYIVENTVGRLCEEKKSELGFREEEYFRGRKRRQKDTLEGLIKILEDYREWLLQLTICDPACGSGAFLNQALDFLIKEHRYIDEMKAKLLGGKLILSDIENTILERNIYGVDINEESVEIAKLSLWLRTAQPRRKLNDLSNSIKCGNSLIDDKKIAGDKAFKWEEEFPEVFAKGGFDVVIGNPPYVRQELFKEIKPYLQSQFKCYNSVADLYVYFIEKSVSNLNKSGGLYSIIVANKWMRANYATELRKWLKNQNIKEIIDFKDLPVFPDATAYPCIITIGGEKNEKNFTGVEVDTLSFPSLDQYVKENTNTVVKENLRAEGWSLADVQITNIVARLLSENISLKEFINSRMYVGLKTGLNEAFIISKDFYLELTKEKKEYEEIVKPYCVGRDISRYGEPEIEKYLICIPSQWTDTHGKFSGEIEAWKWLKDSYPLLTTYLLQFRTKAKKRTDQGKYWWEMRSCDYYSEFEKTKIVYPEISTEGKFTLDDRNIYFDMTSFIIGSESKVLLGILNSKLISFLFNQISSEIRGGFLRWKRQYVYKLPIAVVRQESNFEKIVEKNLEYHHKLHFSLNKFESFFSKNYSIVKHSRKLQSWYELKFSDFIKELNKAIKTNNKEREKEGLQPVPALSKRDEFEWMELFEENKKKALELQREIEKTDNEIDRLVYELYGLTEEEVTIVESKLK